MTHFQGLIQIALPFNGYKIITPVKLYQIYVIVEYFTSIGGKMYNSVHFNMSFCTLSLISQASLHTWAL